MTYKMDKILVIAGVIAILYIDFTLAIRCYRCSVMPMSKNDNMTKQSQLCSKFDESNEFIVDCPYSTMCMKRIFKLPLSNGKHIETIIRGCANQRYTEQVYKNGSWHKEYTVEEPYEEGCTKFEDDSTYCHCFGKLCNDGMQHKTLKYLQIIPLVMVMVNIL